MSELKQRVPMGSVNGTDVFITLEWLKDLRAVISEGATGAGATGSSSDVQALLDAFTALNNSLIALTARVVKLEQGYQS